MSNNYIFGIHAVNALLNNPHRKVTKLFLNKERQDQRLKEITENAKHKKIEVELVTNHYLNQHFPDFNHQGVIAQANNVADYHENDLPYLLEKCKKPALILILDGITDPHNLGACLRSADAAGVDFVVIPKDKNAGITPVVSKVACGALESVPLVKVTNLARSMDIIKNAGVWIYGAAGEASSSLYELETDSSIALVLGAEGTGLRRLTREKCDGLFSIPMYGSVSSLNVSVATGVSLFEVVRSRQII